REFRHLHVPARAVVVLGGLLLLAVLARGHPIEVVGEPFLDRREIVTWKDAGLLKQARRARGLDEVDRVDDADAAAGGDAFDGLGVLEGGVHLRLLGEGAGSRMRERRGGVFLSAGAWP